ncbi:MAG: TolC family protein [Candidatus Zixiibacteriota bacterium]|nr:MAG: TolC family protein [candidate division Zixibacteria bacterium]
MRSLLYKFLLILMPAILAGAGAGAADEGLTLNDCIELALQNRASIIAARGAESLAKADQRSALGAFLPSVSASYDYYESKQRDQTSQFEGFPEVQQPDQDGEGTSLNLSARMSLFDATNFFNFAGARAARAAARLDVINSEQDLIYSVKLSHYAYLASVQNVDVQEQAVARSEEQLKLITSRYDLGSASLSDVLKQKVQYGNDRLALLRARNAVVTSKASLAYTIGIDPNREVEFSADYLVREYQGSLDEALQFGLEHEPGLLAADKNVAAARHGVRSGWSRYLPTLGGYASYSVSDGSQGDTLLFNFSSTTTRYGVSASWTIFDGFFRERVVTSARVNYNNARAYRADTRNLLIHEIKTAYFDMEQQNDAKTVATENVDAANEDLKITQEKYNLGAATILDLLDAQVSLKQAQVSLIQADFDLNLAVARLENAMGKM